MPDFQHPVPRPGTDVRSRDWVVIHELGRQLVISVGDVDIVTYVYAPTTPEVEARKPYLHPIRTLAGAPISAFRPWDHRWHKGFQMTWSHVSGQNFWGGNTFSHEDGYTLKDNVGRMEHNGFDIIELGPDHVSLRETLTWITAAGADWVAETRDLRFHSADLESGTWLLDFSTELRNTRGEMLELGSPTTCGLPNAGYTGFFWRGPRSWTGGEIIAADGQGGEEMMGREANWLAITGKHDEGEGGGTVLVFAGFSSAKVPIKWFVRNQPFAAINPSPAFDEAIMLAPGASITLTHRVAFADRVWTREDAEEFVIGNSL